MGIIYEATKNWFVEAREQSVSVGCEADEREIEVDYDELDDDD